MLMKSFLYKGVYFLYKFIRDPSTSFRGFDTYDVKQSVHRLSGSKFELCDIPLPDIPEMEEMYFHSSTVYSRHYVAESNGSECDIGDMDTKPMMVTLLNEEPQLIVNEIVENVIGGNAEEDKTGVDNEHNGKAKTDMLNEAGIEAIEAILMPKDDPETLCFLSHS